MVVLQFGSMPHPLATKNITELFGREVLPHLQKIWEDKPFENTWWPKRLRNRVRPAARDGVTAESLESSLSRKCGCEKHVFSHLQDDSGPALQFRGAKVRTAGNGPPLVYLPAPPAA